MKFLVFLLLLSFNLSAQNTIPLRADTVKIFNATPGHGNELVLENKTKDTTGGFLQNMGNGRTEFHTITISAGTDSSVFYTKYRSDTSRDNIYAAIVSAGADSFLFYTKYRSDTSRTNIYAAIVAAKADSSIFYTKYRSDTSRTNIYAAIASAGGGTSATRGIDSVLYQLQKITANRKIRGGEFILNFDSLKTTYSNTLDFIPIAILPIKPAETSQVNFNITRSWTANPFGDGDEVVNIGFNAGTNASPEVAGKGAMFWSMEQGYRPSSPTVSLWEWHQEFVNTAGTNRRLSSFTINNAEAANPDIDYFMDLSRIYFKNPINGNVQWQIGDFDNSSAIAQTMATSAWSSSYRMNTSGLQITDAGGTAAGRQFEVDGFGTGNLGGQLGWVAGAQTWVQTGAVGTNPLNIKDGSGHNAYLYNNGSNGGIVLSNSGAGNYNTIYTAYCTSTANVASFQANNDLSETMSIYQTGTTYAGFGAVGANTGMVRGSSANGFILVADNATGVIKFSPGGNNNVSGTFLANGKFLLTGATTARASFNIPSGTAPTSPVDGDTYQDGTHAYMRINGAWKQLDN